MPGPDEQKKAQEGWKEMNCIMCNKENAEVKINDKIAMCQKCSDQETEDRERIDEFIIKGHSDHCACRLVWGDGECECHLRKEKP